MIKAISVIANDDYTITVGLENGKFIKMDMSFIHKQTGPVVEPLKDIKDFKNVFICNGIVTWSTGYDIDPYFLETSGTPVEKTG